MEPLRHTLPLMYNEEFGVSFAEQAECFSVPRETEEFLLQRKDGVNPGSAMPYVLLRSLIGALVLTAASLKGYQLIRSPSTAENWWIASRWFQIGAIEMELFFGLWLLSGLSARPTWRLAIALFAAFGCVSLYKALAAEASCGCFGSVHVNPWLTFVLDLGVIGALLRWRPNIDASGAVLHYRRAGLCLVILVSLLIGIPAGIAMATAEPARIADDGVLTSTSNFVLLEPAQWKGKWLPVLSYVDKSDRLSSGDWIMLFVHHDCPKCQALIPDYEDLAHRGRTATKAARVAIIELPPFGEQPLTADSACLQTRLSSKKDWFMSTPCEVRTHNGLVVNVEENLATDNSLR